MGASAAGESRAPTSRTGSPILQRVAACACGGGCPRCQGAERGIQTKLWIGQPNDACEREADRVAAQVTGMSDGSSGRESAEGEGEANVRAMPLSASSGSAGVSASVAALQRAGGQPLPAAVRSFFEPRFQRDFSEVRVHTHAAAAEAAQSVQARAFTLGRDVVFGEGEYAPGTGAGRQLLAHELTHVVQQRADRGNATPGAESVAQRSVPPIRQVGVPRLQRQGGKPPKGGTQKKVPLPEAILDEANAQRGKPKGTKSKASKAGALKWSDTLANSAAAYCKTMLDKQELSHTADGKTIVKRLNDAGYSSPEGIKGGENLYFNPKVFTAKDAVTWWMGSPPHKKEILEPRYEEAGVSICKGKVKIEGRGKLRDVHIAVMHFGSKNPALDLDPPEGQRVGKAVRWTVTGTVSDNMDPPPSIDVRVKLTKRSGLSVSKLPKNPVTVKKDGSFSFTFETKGKGSAVLETRATDTRGNRAPTADTTKVKV